MNDTWFIPKKERKDIPDDMWTKCPKCNEILFNKDLEKHLRVCPKCGHHFRLRAYDRVAITLDEGTFEETWAGLTPADPLTFPEYKDKVERDTAKTGTNDSFVTGTGEVYGRKIVIGVAEFAFMGGSMGSVNGEKVVRAMELGIEKKLPVVLFTASGGARMQEGILSLMQMAKTSAAVAKMNEAGIPFIVIFTDPTMAGVHASYASLGDFIFSEPQALVGFAGKRVGAQAQVSNMPANFQTAEFQLDCGMIDGIVTRSNIRPLIARIVDFCESGEV